MKNNSMNDLLSAGARLINSLAAWVEDKNKREAEREAMLVKQAEKMAEALTNNPSALKSVLGPNVKVQAVSNTSDLNKLFGG